MSDLAKKFLEHSARDEFGNLVLLFEDKQIKMAIEEDGEPFLCCQDISGAFGVAPRKWSNQKGPSRTRMAVVDRGAYRAKSQFVRASAVCRMRIATDQQGMTGFAEFLKKLTQETVEPASAVKPVKRSAIQCEAIELPRRGRVEYRFIEGFPGYCAGDDGSIWSSKTGEWRQMAQRINRDGYYIVGIMKATSDGSINHNALVHRLVLLAFKGSPEPHQETLHGNGIKTDNRPCNLRWGTSYENSMDARSHRSARISEN